MLYVLLFYVISIIIIIIIISYIYIYNNIVKPGPRYRMDNAW